MGNFISVMSGFTESFYNNFIVEDRYMHIVNGLKTTLIITFFAVLLGTLLGGGICWMRMNRRKWLRSIATVKVSYSEKNKSKDVEISVPGAIDAGILEGEGFRIKFGMTESVVAGSDLFVIAGLDPIVIAGSDPIVVEGLDPIVIAGSDPQSYIRFSIASKESIRYVGLAVSRVPRE